jgi:hypothetical protein
MNTCFQTKCQDLAEGTDIGTITYNFALLLCWYFYSKKKIQMWVAFGGNIRSYNFIEMLQFIQKLSVVKTDDDTISLSLFKN